MIAWENIELGNLYASDGRIHLFSEQNIAFETHRTIGVVELDQQFIVTEKHVLPQNVSDINYMKYGIKILVVGSDLFGWAGRFESSSLFPIRKVNEKKEIK